MLTVLLGTGGSVDSLSRIGCRPFFTANVSVNSGLTAQQYTHLRKDKIITLLFTITGKSAGMGKAGQHVQ